MNLKSFVLFLPLTFVPFSVEAAECSKNEECTASHPIICGCQPCGDIEMRAYPKDNPPPELIRECPPVKKDLNCPKCKTNLLEDAAVCHENKCVLSSHVNVTKKVCIHQQGGAMVRDLGTGRMVPKRNSPQEPTDHFARIKKSKLQFLSHERVEQAVCKSKGCPKWSFYDVFAIHSKDLKKAKSLGLKEDCPN